MFRDQGHFGKVSLYCYDPTNDGTGEMVAVKALKADCSPQLRTGWRREIDILRTLYHKHIVKYRGCCEDPGGRGRQGLGPIRASGCSLGPEGAPGWGRDGLEALSPGRPLAWASGDGF